MRPMIPLWRAVDTMHAVGVPSRVITGVPSAADQTTPRAFEGES